MHAVHTLVRELNNQCGAYSLMEQDAEREVNFGDNYEQPA